MDFRRSLPEIRCQSCLSPVPRGSTTDNGIMKPEADRGHIDIARVHIPRERKEPMARRGRALRRSPQPAQARGRAAAGAPGVSVPSGGGKGGFMCDPPIPATTEGEKTPRRYTAEIIDFIGPERDVPAPDVNTNEKVMAWIMDTYSMHARHTVTAVVTGKPMALGGSRGRPEATGRGCMIVTLKALERFGLQPESTSIVIQGFGNVGGMAAKLMAARGFKIVAIVEYDGAVYNPKGLDIAALQKHRKETGSVTGFSEAEDMDRQEAMFLPCDVLLPGATENVITSQNAGRLRCKILCEGANGPTTPLADIVLEDKKVFVIPDILANAGGVTVSYFEWVQDRQGFFWNEQLVNQRLEEIMVESFDAVVAYADKHGVNNRIAAYMVALDRVAVAIRLRGIYA